MLEISILERCLEKYLHRKNNSYLKSLYKKLNLLMRLHHIYLFNKFILLVHNFRMNLMIGKKIPQNPKGFFALSYKLRRTVAITIV